MNKKKLEGLLDKKIWIWPIPCELNAAGARVGSPDDLWNVVRIHDTGLDVVNVRNHVALTVTYDYVVNYQMAEGSDGHLCLKGQVYLQGAGARIVPGPYPGPRPATPKKKRVAAPSRTPADEMRVRRSSWVHGWRDSTWRLKWRG